MKSKGKAGDDKKKNAQRAAVIHSKRRKSAAGRAQETREADKAEATLQRAQERHDEVMASIKREREKLDRRAQIENDKWKSERNELNAVRGR
jgi:hypothetical protein